MNGREQSLRLALRRGATFGCCFLLAIGHPPAAAAAIRAESGRPEAAGPGQLVLVHGTLEDAAAARVDTMNWSYPRYMALRAANSVFEELAAFRPLVAHVESADRSVEIVSPTYFAVLGVEAIHGRTFTSSDDGSAVAVIGHDLWRREFGADPSVLGRVLRVEGHAFTVVGVMPEGFHGLSGAAEAWVPLTMSPTVYGEEALAEPWHYWLSVVGRLRPGISIAEATRAVSRARARVAEIVPAPPVRACEGVALVPVDPARVDPTLHRTAWVL